MNAAGRRTVPAVTTMARLIGIIAAAASTGHALDLLRGWGAGSYSYAVPAAVVLMAGICALVLHTPAAPAPLQLAAAAALTLAAAAAIAANLAAAPNTAIKATTCFLVAAYLGAQGAATALHRAHQARHTRPEPATPARPGRAGSPRRGTVTDRT